ncbi:hypothetical protein F2Q69_00063613 [Brassica cretica]|uniref:Uncharacterized protein n=1 Tax=Brassica cretica TaxID=69181 RepID=A0A8S9RRU6_BRACR|nr:hypothetical protein F2Q69_00063613 [Brassica cretica]
MIIKSLPGPSHNVSFNTSPHFFNVFLADLKIGICSTTVEVRLLRSWEGGGELIYVDMQFLDAKCVCILQQLIQPYRTNLEALPSAVVHDTKNTISKNTEEKAGQEAGSDH